MGASADGADKTTFLAPPYKDRKVQCYKEFHANVNGFVRAWWALTHLTVWDREQNKLVKETFLCAEALSIVVKTPEDSTTYSAP